METLTKRRACQISCRFEPKAKKSDDRCLIASALGLTGFLGVIIMVVCAVIGAGITLAVFDAFIVVASSLGGTGLAMDGGHLIFQSLGFLDRTAIAQGAVTPLIIWIVGGAIAMGWQFMNIERWTSNQR